MTKTDQIKKLIQDQPHVLDKILDSCPPDIIDHLLVSANIGERYTIEKYPFPMPYWFNSNIESEVDGYVSADKKLTAAKHLIQLTKKYDTANLFGFSWVTKVLDFRKREKTNESSQSQ